MKQYAKVRAVFPDGKVMAEVARQGACAHECASCGGCNERGQKIQLMLSNSLQAQVGDRVEIESSSQTLLLIMLLVYSAAPVLFFIAYFLTAGKTSAGLCAVISVCAFFLGMLPAVFFDRHLKKTGGIKFTMVRVIEKAPTEGKDIYD